ncbi:MAG: hypothetical protein ACXAE3_02060 [Candidatus Kariarchaeaceae archaeon]
MAQTQQYEIKAHQEPYTEPEIFLRRELEKVLPENIRNYTTVANLESLKNYRATAETFHPENHFYAFQGEELVGFIHLWPQYTEGKVTGENAAISIPFVRPGYEDAANQLLTTVVEKAKSYESITNLTISTPSENTLELGELKKYGFVYNQVERVYSSAPIETLQFTSPGITEVVDFNLEEHGDAVVAMYEALGHPGEAIRNQFNWTKDMGDRIIAWKVAKLKGSDELVGHAVCFEYEEQTDETRTAQVNTVTRGVGLDEETYQKVAKDVYQVLFNQARAKNVKTIDVNIMRQVLDLRPFYESLGFEFTQSDSYIKALSEF